MDIEEKSARKASKRKKFSYRYEKRYYSRRIEEK